MTGCDTNKEEECKLFRQLPDVKQLLPQLLASLNVSDAGRMSPSSLHPPALRSDAYAGPEDYHYAYAGPED